MGAGFVSRAALCARSARRPPFDSRQHRSVAGSDGDHHAVRIPFQDRMHVSGNEASDRRIRLSLLERVDAEAEPLPPQRRDGSAGAGDRTSRTRKRIRLTFRAIEGFVMCSVIATGIVQLLALRFSGRTPALFFRYLRTPSKVDRVGGDGRRLICASRFFACLLKTRNYPLTQIIRSKQKSAHL